MSAEDVRKAVRRGAAPKGGNSFGARPVRSYVLDERRVTDHRTGVVSHDPDTVLDGGLDAFIEAELARRVT